MAQQLRKFRVPRHGVAILGWLRIEGHFLPLGLLAEGIGEIQQPDLRLVPDGRPIAQVIISRGVHPAEATDAFAPELGAADGGGPFRGVLEVVNAGDMMLQNASTFQLREQALAA